MNMAGGGGLQGGAVRAVTVGSRLAVTGGLQTGSDQR